MPGSFTATGATRPRMMFGLPWRLAFTGAQEAPLAYLRDDIYLAQAGAHAGVGARPHYQVAASTCSCSRNRMARYHFDQEAIREPVTGGTKIAREGHREEKLRYRTPAGWNDS